MTDLNEGQKAWSLHFPRMSDKENGTLQYLAILTFFCCIDGNSLYIIENQCEIKGF